MAGFPPVTYLAEAGAPAIEGWAAVSARHHVGVCWACMHYGAHDFAPCGVLVRSGV